MLDLDGLSRLLVKSPFSGFSICKVGHSTHDLVLRDPRSKNVSYKQRENILHTKKTKLTRVTVNACVKLTEFRTGVPKVLTFLSSHPVQNVRLVSPVLDVFFQPFTY